MELFACAHAPLDGHEEETPHALALERQREIYGQLATTVSGVWSRQVGNSRNLAFSASSEPWATLTVSRRAGRTRRVDRGGNTSTKVCACSARAGGIAGVRAQVYGPPHNNIYSILAQDAGGKAGPLSEQLFDRARGLRNSGSGRVAR